MLLASLPVLLASLPLTLELSAGAASTPDRGPTAPAAQARAGVEVLPWLTLGASLLGVLGPDPEPCSACHHAAFQAYAGLATVRLHSTGTLRVFAERGLGVGHLVRLSDDDVFENPSESGRAGLAGSASLGLRYQVAGGLALGLELEWAGFTHLQQPAFTYGATPIPDRNDLTAGAFLLLFSVGFSSHEEHSNPARSPRYPPRPPPPAGSPSR